MNVIELRNELNDLIDDGKGDYGVALELFFHNRKPHVSHLKYLACDDVDRDVFMEYGML